MFFSSFASKLSIFLQLIFPYIQVLLAKKKNSHAIMALKSHRHDPYLVNSSYPLSDLLVVCFKAKVPFERYYADWKTLQIRDQIANTIATNIIFGIAEEEGFNIGNQENCDLDVLLKEFQYWNSQINQQKDVDAFQNSKKVETLDSILDSGVELDPLGIENSFFH